MKKLASILLFLVLLPFVAGAQGKVYTKKGRLEGFQSKTVKVVIPDTTALGLTLRRSVSAVWVYTPFEFCYPWEYDALKGDSRYFFLRVCPYEGENGQEKVLCLDYSQGGGKNQETLKAAFRVVQIPISSGADSLLTERELAYMPALVDAVQRYALWASTSVSVSHAGLSAYNKAYPVSKEFKTSFCEDDLAPGTLEALHSDIAAGRCNVSTAQDDISIYNGFEPYRAVSLVIVPDNPAEGDYCYKMMIGTDTHALYHFERCRMKNSGDSGLSAADVRRLRK